MATAGFVFVSLLVTASITIGAIGPARVRALRTVGPAVKRWSGSVLVAVGVWFLVLALLPDPIIG